jgi:hypothetical protein
MRLQLSSQLLAWAKLQAMGCARWSAADHLDPRLISIRHVCVTRTGHSSAMERSQRLSVGLSSTSICER